MLADEDIEGIVVLFKAAKGHAVGVKIQHQPQPLRLASLGLHLVHLLVLAALHLPDQLSVLGGPEGLSWVQCTAYSGIGRYSLEDVRTVHLEDIFYLGKL